MLILADFSHKDSRFLLHMQESDPTNCWLYSYIVLPQRSGTWSSHLYITFYLPKQSAFLTIMLTIFFSLFFFLLVLPQGWRPKGQFKMYVSQIKIFKALLQTNCITSYNGKERQKSNSLANTYGKACWASLMVSLPVLIL